MYKHTPGPWHVVPGTFGSEIHCARGAHCTPGVTQLASALGRLDTAQAKTDARLMAAAPELADALEWATGFLEANYRISDMPELAMLRAALTKAGL